MTPAPLLMPPPIRPAWEAVVLFLLGVLVGAVSMGLLRPACAQAAGPVTLTWNQPSDCEAVTGWELLVAPITTTQPNPDPTAATLGASIATSDTPPCGSGMTRTLATLTGASVGPTRFWLRAVAGAIRSDASAGVDAGVPLGKPTGLTVVFP